MQFGEDPAVDLDPLGDLAAASAGLEEGLLPFAAVGKTLPGIEAVDIGIDDEEGEDVADVVVSPFRKNSVIW